MLSANASLSAVTLKPKIDIFGCPKNRLGKDQELRGSGIKFFRKGSDDPHLGQISTEADDRGFVAGASQGIGHRRRIFRANHSTCHDFDTQSVYVRDLADSYRADMEGSFDFLLIELSRSFLAGLAEEHGWKNKGQLSGNFGHNDPTLSSLLRAAQPALEKTKQASLLYLDHLGLSIGIHLVENYGHARAPAVTFGNPLLSRAQMSKVTERLQNDLSGNISVAELASACRLSRGYFIHAFKATTGATPHQWVLSQRVKRARDLMCNSDLPLVDIALTCGFADQSHFTRTFARLTGISPGSWRRSARA